MRVGVENHSGGVTATVDGSVRLCKEIPSTHFGILYDPGNLLGVKEDYKALLAAVPERIVHIHMKDGFPHYFGDDGYAPQRLSCTAFGKGELDIPFILAALDANGYEGFVSVEYEAWHPEYRLPPVDTGLPDSLKYLMAHSPRSEADQH